MVNWSDMDSLKRLLACYYLSSGEKANCSRIAYFFSHGTTYDSIEGQFRKIRSLAATIKNENRDPAAKPGQKRSKKRKCQPSESDSKDFIKSREWSPTVIKVDADDKDISSSSSPNDRSSLSPYNQNEDSTNRGSRKSARRVRTPAKDRIRNKAAIRRGKQRENLEVLEITSDDEGCKFTPLLDRAARKDANAGWHGTLSQFDGNCSSPLFGGGIDEDHNIADLGHDLAELESFNVNSCADPTNDSGTSPNAMLELNKELAGVGVRSSPRLDLPRRIATRSGDPLKSQSSKMNPSKRSSPLRQSFSVVVPARHPESKDDGKDHTEHALGAHDVNGDVRPDIWEGLRKGFRKRPAHYQ